MEKKTKETSETTPVHCSASGKCHMAFHALSRLGKKLRQVRIALALAYETGGVKSKYLLFWPRREEK